MKKFINEFLERWRAESPSFWVKAKNLAIKLGTGAVGVLGADKLFDLQTYGVPQIVFTIAGYVIVACVTLGLSAQITKK
jgi:hypothetical protein